MDFVVPLLWSKLMFIISVNVYFVLFYDVQGELTYGKIGEWRFDKRSYLHGPPPRNLSLPPPGVPESVVRLVKFRLLNNYIMLF